MQLGFLFVAGSKDGDTWSRWIAHRVAWLAQSRTRTQSSTCSSSRVQIRIGGDTRTLPSGTNKNMRREPSETDVVTISQLPAINQLDPPRERAKQEVACQARGVIPACSPNGQILHIVARATPCVVYYAVRGATFWTKFVRKLEEQDVHWRIRGDELGMDPAYQRPGCHTLDAPLQLEEEGGHSRDQQVEQPTDTANHDTDTRATEGEPQLGPSQTFHVPEAMLQRYAPSLGCEMSSVYRVKSKPQRDLPSTHDSVDLPGGQ